MLRTLAATQADAVDPQAEALPGKILHDLRHGEMANLREIPFARYYGSIDATPLFIMLAGLYLHRPGDVATVRRSGLSSVPRCAGCRNTAREGTARIVVSK